MPGKSTLILLCFKRLCNVFDNEAFPEADGMTIELAIRKLHSHFKDPIVCSQLERKKNLRGNELEIARLLLIKLETIIGNNSYNSTSAKSDVANTLLLLSTLLAKDMDSLVEKDMIHAGERARSIFNDYSTNSLQPSELV